jgi:hypothetical protein
VGFGVLFRSGFECASLLYDVAPGRNTTPVFYFGIPPSVSPIVIVIMYYLVPTPKPFEIMAVNYLSKTTRIKLSHLKITITVLDEQRNKTYIFRNIRLQSQLQELHRN